MRGYLHDATATAAAFDAQGYFDTGDLVRANTATGDLVITGRFKDTIVLSNGENVAPQPIEDALVGASELVDQVRECTLLLRCLRSISVAVDLLKLGYIFRG
jgi:long-chain acyl-CoA synthetase